jgi:excisionase family DNA binding protein
VLEILTVVEVATELRCSKAHVSKAIAGKLPGVTPLPAVSLGRRRLVRRAALLKWIEENERGILSASPKHDSVNA